MVLSEQWAAILQVGIAFPLGSIASLRSLFDPLSFQPKAVTSMSDAYLRQANEPIAG